MAHPMSIRNSPRCNHCGNLGHTEDKCFKLHAYPPAHRHYRKGNTHRASSSLSSSNPPEDSKDVLSNNESLQQLLRLLPEVNQPKANLAGEFLALNSSVCKPNEWVIDTGATDHVTYNPHLFSSPPIAFDNPSTISVPNGESVPIYEKALHPLVLL